MELHFKGEKSMLQVKMKNATGKILFYVTFALKETQVLHSKCKSAHLFL